jgi:hypothetical protein
MFRSLRTVAVIGAVVAVTAVATTSFVDAAGASPSSSSTIASFSPSSAGVGSTVTIVGSGLSDATAVDFNFTVAAPITTDTGSEITTTVPLGVDDGPITVETPGGAVTSASIFTLVGFYITTVTLPDVVPGTHYAEQLQTVGGTGQDQWSRAEGLPEGLTLTRGGWVTGTPSPRKAVAGTYSFSVRVRDSAKRHRQVAVSTLTLTVT